jgi:hypothetical protein
MTVHVSQYAGRSAVDLLLCFLKIPHRIILHSTCLLRAGLETVLCGGHLTFVPEAYGDVDAWS